MTLAELKNSTQLSFRINIILLDYCTKYIVKKYTVFHNSVFLFDNDSYISSLYFFAFSNNSDITSSQFLKEYKRQKIRVKN